MKERRSGKIVRGRFQLMFGLVLAIPIVLSLLTMTIGVLYWLVTLEAKNKFWAGVIKEEWVTFTIIMGFCMFFLILVHVFYVMKISHRLAGPMVAVERYLKSLKTHQGTKRLVLREGDELMKLADEMEEFKKNNPKFFQ